MKSTAIRWTKKFSQKETGAKKLFATTTTPTKKLFALTKCPSPPPKK
jgi:hypothetical protein